jgi:histone deacetylase 4/5
MCTRCNSKEIFVAAKGDPLGECEITPYGYSHLTHKLLELAGGKIVLALEGGYNLESISKSYAACTSVLLGDPPMAAPPEDTPLRLSSCTLDILNQVRKRIRTKGSVPLQTRLQRPFTRDGTSASNPFL